MLAVISMTRRAWRRRRRRARRRRSPARGRASPNSAAGTRWNAVHDPRAPQQRLDLRGDRAVRRQHRVELVAVLHEVVRHRDDDLARRAARRAPARSGSPASACTARITTGGVARRTGCRRRSRRPATRSPHSLLAARRPRRAPCRPPATRTAPRARRSPAGPRARCPPGRSPPRSRSASAGASHGTAP